MQLSRHRWQGLLGQQHLTGIVATRHQIDSREVRIDRSGEAVSDLAEARDRAAGIVRSLIMGRDAEDWRDWVVHVSDDFDDEIFVLPFAFVLGKPH